MFLTSNFTSSNGNEVLRSFAATSTLRSFAATSTLRRQLRSLCSATSEVLG